VKASNSEMFGGRRSSRKDCSAFGKRDRKRKGSAGLVADVGVGLTYFLWGGEALNYFPEGNYPSLNMKKQRIAKGEKGNQPKKERQESSLEEEQLAAPPLTKVHWGRREKLDLLKER